MVDSIISTAVSTIFDACVGATKEHLGYIWNYKKNMASLEEQVKKLEKERADKSYSVTIAEKDAQKINERVKSWLEDASNTCEETAQIINDYKEKGQKKCFMGVCPNLVSRYRLSKKACEKETEIAGAISEAEKIEKVSKRAIGLGKEIALSTEGISTFKSRELVLEDIMKALQDETKNMIGVYGLGGMGKTTLAKQVAARADEEHMFDEVVFAPVTKDVKLKIVQEKIASMLDLKLENSTEADTAGLICARLKGKRVLVILDDLWKELDLNDVGIPHGAEHMGCKIMLTSRSLPVLSSMGSKKEFLLGALEEEEAWRLFEEKTIDVIKDPAFLAIGKKVAKRCAGLPVLIVTVAASLSKRRRLPAWNDALKQLKKMDNTQIHEIVNSAMKTISYNHLGEKHKKLFLLCGVLGGTGNVFIEELFQYSFGLDMFDGEAETMGEARNRLHAWILDLKESCLLLDSDSRGDRNSIKMHDVVRDVAISIAEKDFNMHSAEGSGAELNIRYKNGVLKRCTAMVFRGCPNLSGLPQQLECPSLELCILSQPYEYGRTSFNIPNTFFEKTCNLTVLDMSYSCVSTLPSSLSFLKNLQIFRVECCDSLKDIYVVGELKKLQILSFSGTGIEELPSGIGQLLELRSLDLSYCSDLRTIPAGLIAGLSRLEELKMGGSFDRWGVEDCFNNNGRTNVSISELNHLLNLTGLEIAVPNAELLSKDLRFEKLEKYEIIVGDMWSGQSFSNWLEELDITRKVCLQLSSTSIHQLQHVLRTECLCLGELKGVKNVTPELDVDGFPYMKHLRIKRDYDIQYVVNAEYRQDMASFPALESLHLSHLVELQKICNGRLMEDSFRNLKVVKVKNCNRLESLFSFSMAIGLQCLEEIHVAQCNVVEGIVADKNSEDGDVNNNDGVQEKIEFVQLRIISLKCLPKLNNFFSSKSLTKKESEEIVPDEADFKSSMPSFNKVSFPKLEVLELSKISNLTHILSHRLPCCNLTRLKVEDCDNLQYLLTPSASKALNRLRDLIVKGCVKMKNIVVEEEGETNMETICFPHLSYLCLEKLPNLTTFYSRSVGEMDANESPDIAVQSLFNEKVKLPILKTLEIRNLNGIKMIWPQMSRKAQNLTQDLSLQTLQRVEVDDCQSLEHVFPASVVGALNKLEELRIQDCGMETIIGDDKDTEFPTFTFPKLVKFNLCRLSKLKCFYPREHTSQWPALAELVVSGCDEIQPSLLPLFSIEKDAFPSNKLLDMKISICEGLKYLFTPSMAMNLEKVHKLSIRFCSKMEAIVSNEGEAMAYSNTIIFPQLIDLKLNCLGNLRRFYSSVEEMDSNEKLDYDDQPLFNQKIQFPRLGELSISGLDNINSIWKNHQVKEVSIRTPINSKKESHKVLFSFPNVQKVTVYNCKSLEHVFPVSVAQSLNKLEELMIDGCMELKTIIGDESYMETPVEIEQVATTFVFPELTKLELERLRKLECFYLREHTCEWPALEVLRVRKCDKVSAFDFLRIPERKGDNRFEKVISKLELMRITPQGMNKMVRLYDGQIPPHLFRSLETLTIAEFHGEATTFPSKFLSIIPNRLELEVSKCSFQELFPYEGEVICKKEEYSTFIHVLDQLSSLEVTECHLLTNLVPPSVSFKSLKHLTVKDCGGLINLIQPSIATSLEHLRSLYIRGCDRIEEIIGEVKDDKEGSSSFGHEIIFNSLTELSLLDLPRLTNFSSSCSYTFNFPELRVVYVKECPNMKTFCRGITTTPNLGSVYLNEFRTKEHWEGELNTTIEQIYVEREAKRLGIAIPSTPSNNHFEAEAQANQSLAEGVNETPMEAQTRPNDTNQEKVANIIDEGKGKEVEVSREVEKHSEKSQDTPRSSDPSCSNYAARGQTLAADAAPSQHIGASSSHLSPQISNLPHEVIPLAIEGTLAASTISPDNQIEEKVQFHDKPTGVLPESRKEGMICKNGELVNQDQVCDNGINPRKEMELCGNATEPIKEVDIGDKAVKLTATCGKVEEQTVAVSQASQDVGASSSNPQQKDIQERIYEEREAKRLGTTITSTSSNSHFEAQAQAHESSGEGVSEATMEAQTRPNDTNQEKVASIVDKGKQKQVEVSKEVTEYFERSQDTPHSSNPACSNYVARGQTFAADLTPSQHVGASSSQLSPRICNPLHEQVETLAASTVSPNNQIEEKVQFHDKPTRMLPEPRKEGLICKNGANGGALVNEDQVCDNGTNPGKEMELCGNATEPIGEQVTREGKEAIKPVKLASTCGIADEQTIAVSDASRDVGASSSNSQQTDIQELHVTKNFIPLMSPALASQAESQRLQDMASTSLDTARHATEVGTSIAASSSLQKGFQGLHGIEDIIAWTSEYFQNLQTLEMKSINAEQVKFMEEASEWFSGYVRQARECVEQNKVISELELKIAETEALMRALQEKKRAAEEIYEAKASSTLPRFG